MSTERKSHRIDETGDLFCSDGYEWMEASEKKGWHTVASWGKSGWDLGSWPLVVMSWRQRDDGLWDVAEHVEGDLAILEGATIEERDAWIDVKAVWHWLVGQSDGPVQTYVDSDGNRTPDNQNWEHRVNLVQIALHEHLMSREFHGRYGDPDYGPIGHMLYGLGTYVAYDRTDRFDIAGGTLWDIHQAMHAERALRAGRQLTDDELVDWMDPDWRGPYSRARSDADKENSSA